MEVSHKAGEKPVEAGRFLVEDGRQPTFLGLRFEVAGGWRAVAGQQLQVVGGQAAAVDEQVQVASE